MSASKRKQAHYHHGDLRQALIDAGVAILEEKKEELTLRAAARRAGASAMAPYRHFADKAALLAAIAAHGFDELAGRLERADSQSDPADALGEQGAAYVRFACEHPAMFRLIFSSGLPSGNAELNAAGKRAHQVLADRAASLKKGKDASELTLAAWSIVHGLAGLVLEGKTDLNKAAAIKLARQFAGKYLV